MSQRSLYLAAYDIAEPKRLKAFLKLLRGYASGGQKSVFECWLTPKERGDLIYMASVMMEPDVDRFMIFTLDGRQKVSTLGKAVKPADKDWYYIG
jgi:CRISPR-associated protein Cas2